MEEHAQVLKKLFQFFFLNVILYKKINLIFYIKIKLAIVIVLDVQVILLVQDVWVLIHFKEILQMHVTASLQHGIMEEHAQVLKKLFQFFF
jgi:hypothetical protein